MVLANAAIHRCHAGERRYAYEVICLERLSRQLKAYVIFYLGEYSTPKTVMSALFGAAGVAAVSSLTKGQEAMCVHVLALCCRYQNQLDLAREHEEDAWNRAKLTGSIMVTMPIGVNVIRLCHIFGNLRRAKEVESKLFLMMLKEKVFGVFGRKLMIPKENVADGAGFVAALLALSHVYRNPRRTKMIHYLLQAGIKQCRDAGEKFDVLVPTFGRPWHALVLIELGELDRCEVAMESGEWGTDMLRYQQTATFELLTAKFHLAKALTLRGSQRDDHINQGLRAANVAIEKVSAANYTWWLTLATLTKGQILAVVDRKDDADEALSSARTMSEQGPFHLLHVDTLLAQAQTAYARGNLPASRDLAQAALAESNEWEYGLRHAALKGILKKTKS